MSERSQHNGMRFEIVKITPQMAREWLALFPERPQRTIRPRNVNKITHAIENGTWRITHQAIALGPDGYVLDGRHRLTAIAQQRKHVSCLVAFDCDPADFAVMDTGAGRSPGDTLKTAGFTDVNVLSATTRQVIAYPELIGTTNTLASVANKLTNTDILEAMQDPDLGKQIQDSVHAGYRVAKGIGRYGMRTSATVLASCIGLYTTHGVDAQEEFFTRLGDGLRLDVGSPIYVFRRWLSQDSGYMSLQGTWRPTVFLYSGIKCWNDYATGEERRALRIRPGQDIMPEVV